jgi:RNA polymerase sigma-70 factor (ECF subfamily)
VHAEEAFDQYHEAVFRFVYRLTGRVDLAEDITQECFLALVRTPERFDRARGTIKTYLFSIARNLALKNYRDNRAAAQFERNDAALVADPRASQELSSAVEQAVAGLPAMQQEALVLFEYEGFTLEEVAHVVDADIGTVKSRLHRARARLKRTLAPYRKLGDLHGTV